MLLGLSLQAQLALRLDSVDEVSRTQRYKNEELRYYERTHSLRDEGFGTVMTYWQRLILEMVQTDSLRAVLQEAADASDPALPERLAFLEQMASGRSEVIAWTERRRSVLNEWMIRTFWSSRADMNSLSTPLSPLIPQGHLLAPWCGTVRDSLGTYTGEMDASLRPEGYGYHVGADGTYREGFWHEGVPDGWNMMVQRQGLVLSGRWRKGRFVGERMEHTPDRVYGIDISRYQHDQGRASYPIDWHQLAITRLGHDIQTTDTYPVCFVFIKATQGTTITSRYYLSDSRAARRRGIAVGAYHFFSPTSGLAQAQHFLSVAKPQSGDLPPVLDVELTERQVEEMGGEEAMFSEIETWLYTVQKACGTRPLLYMNQNFVVNHLPNAPLTVQGCQMWVARYSDYRPFVRLALWQLSQSGHVRGIRGNVDINVYNGTREMFDEFRQQNAVR